MQFLFGFLLAVTFTEAYARVSGFDKVVHLIAVLFATASVALLTAPAAWPRPPPHPSSLCSGRVSGQ